MTLKQAADLRRGQIVHHAVLKNADGTPQRWKINGKAHGNGDTFRIPIKRGLYQHGEINPQNIHLIA